MIGVQIHCVQTPRHPEPCVHTSNCVSIAPQIAMGLVSRQQVTSNDQIGEQAVLATHWKRFLRNHMPEHLEYVAEVDSEANLKRSPYSICDSQQDNADNLSSWM